MTYDEHIQFRALVVFLLFVSVLAGFCIWYYEHMQTREMYLISGTPVGIVAIMYGIRWNMKLSMKNYIVDLQVRLEKGRMRGNDWSEVDAEERFVVSHALTNFTTLDDHESRVYAAGLVLWGWKSDACPEDFIKGLSLLEQSACDKRNWYLEYSSRLL